MARAILNSKLVLPWVLLALLAGCSDSKEDADAGLDGSTDTDSDTDSDTDTETDAGTDTDTDSDTDTETDTDADGGTELTLDLDCTDPAALPTELCNIYSNPCDEEFVCSELLWVDSPTYPNIIANYCFPECAEEPADGGVDAGADAGPFSPCDGSDTACVTFDEGLDGCMLLGQIKAEFEVVVAPIGETPVPSDFPFVHSFACASVAFNPGIAMAAGETVADAGVSDAGPTTDEIRFVWIKPRAFLDPQGYKLTVTIPADNWLDGEVLDLSEDPSAFAAWVLHAEYEMIGPTYTNAWIEAVATSGTITIENAADPCSGSDCEPATGTMNIWFEMRRAELDPSTVPPL